MNNPGDRGVTLQLQERAILSLIEKTSASPDEVRALFMRESARLEEDARIHTHVQALTIARVKALLRRSAMQRADGERG